MQIAEIGPIFQEELAAECIRLGIADDLFRGQRAIDQSGEKQRTHIVQKQCGKQLIDALEHPEQHGDPRKDHAEQHGHHKNCRHTQSFRQRRHKQCHHSGSNSTHKQLSFLSNVIGTSPKRNGRACTNNQKRCRPVQRTANGQGAAKRSLKQFPKERDWADSPQCYEAGAN